MALKSSLRSNASKVESQVMSDEPSSVDEEDVHMT